MIDESAAAVAGRDIGLREMCETISRCWAAGKGFHKTPEEIFNYSPTGELGMVFEWYWDCRRWEAGELGGPAVDAYLADRARMEEYHP